MLAAILLLCGAVAAVAGSRGESNAFSGATTQVALEKKPIVKVKADNYPACFLFSNENCRNGFTTLNAQPVCVHKPRDLSHGAKRHWLVGVVLGLLVYLQLPDELWLRLVHELRQLPK